MGSYRIASWRAVGEEGPGAPTMVKDGHLVLAKHGYAFEIDGDGRFADYELVKSRPTSAVLRRPDGAFLFVDVFPAVTLLTEECPGSDVETIETLVRETRTRGALRG